MLKMLKKKRKGFTLIELMIVIAIIAILAAILVPNFIRARAQSQLSACSGNLKNIATALELYSTDNNGSYITATTLNLLTGPTMYMRQVPSCPADASAYDYTGSNNPSNYTVSQGTGTTHTGAGAGAAGSCFGSTVDCPAYAGSQGLVTK